MPAGSARRPKLTVGRHDDGLGHNRSRAVVTLSVIGPGEQSATVHSVVDTGFSGWLALPPDIVQRLALVWRRRSSGLLANGDEALFDIHDATVIWYDRPRIIAVDAIGVVPLVGMSMFEGCRLTIDVRVDGEVAIRPL